MDEQKLNKKLAEWAGIVGWRPQLSHMNFTQSLDACFKWLVPQSLGILAGEGFLPPTIKLFQLWYDELVSLTGDSSKVEQSALTLCLAIEKLVDEANK